MNIALVIAGGKGLRVGANVPKQYLVVRHKPIIVWTLENLQSLECIDKIVVVAAEEWHEFITDWQKKSNINKLFMLANAGETRMESTFFGLTAIKSFANVEDNIILIDANRPLAAKESFEDVLKKIIMDGSVITLEASYDTLLITDHDNLICGSVDRSHVWKGQTPEGAKLGLMLDVYRAAIIDGLQDQAMPLLMMHYGHRVVAAKGFPQNFKITTQKDIELFEAYLLLLKKA